MGEVIVAKLCVIFVGKGNEEILSLKEIAWAETKCKKKGKYLNIKL